MRRSARAIAAAATLLAAAAGRPARAQPPPALAEGQRVIVPPKLVHFVEAEFPPSEVAAGKGATVVLQIAISAAGTVADVKVAESAGPAFDGPAVAAARQFLFEPARVDGKAIPVKITYRYGFTFVEKLVKKTTADFEGVVRDRRTRTPLASVRVSLDTGQQTITDEFGKFAIADVPVGEHTVTLSGEHLATVGTTETFEASKKIDATYEVDPKREKVASGDEEEEIVVTAPKIKKQVVSTEVQATQATRVPGTQGDVLKVVENLPGIARAAAGSGALVVWGAAPNDTRVYVAGIRVPRLYHDGAFGSVVNSDLVRSVELVPGGYGSAYGRGLGGLVTVALRPLDEEGVHGSVGADAIDASASVRARVGDRLHVAIAARKSYLDSTLAAGDGVLSNAHVPGVSDPQTIGQYVPIPSYWDGQSRLVYDLGPHETLELGGLVSSDLTTRSLANADPTLSTRQTSGTNFGRVYLRYEKHLEDGGTVEVTPSWGIDYTSLLNVYGTTPTELTDHSDVYALRAAWRGPVRPGLRATVGVDAEMVVANLHRSGSIGAPPREGDVYVFGEPPPPQINSDDWQAVVGSVAPYVETDVSLLDDRLHIVPGARLEPYITQTNKALPPPPGNPPVATTREEPVLEPRISARYAFTPEISVKAAFGEYHQAPQPEDLSAVFGTPTLALSRADQGLVGATFQLTQTLSVEVTGFYSTMDNLVVRSQSDSPLAGQALDQTGIGRSYGTQFLLRQQQIGPFFAWISYTISRSERKDAPNLDWRLFDYDQPHVFTAVGSYDLGKGWDTGLRLRVSSGYPRTPVISSFYDATTDTYEPLFGAHNSIRIPLFYALDLRLAKRFRISGGEAEVFLDVQNVTNHQNPDEIVYNPTYSQRGYINGLPILPNLGVRWSW